MYIYIYVYIYIYAYIQALHPDFSLNPAYPEP